MDKSQIGLPVTVKIRDGKLRGPKRDGSPDHSRDLLIRSLELKPSCQEGSDHTEDRKSWKKESVEKIFRLIERSQSILLSQGIGKVT